MKINKAFQPILSALILCFSAIPFQAFTQDKKDPILMTIGGKEITQQEFEKIYHKNNNKETGGDKKSLQDYLDLYVNYKLKVLEAEEMKIDTGTNFSNELSGYRRQLAQPYMIDKESMEKLTREAYQRMKTDVRASHLLIKVAADAPPEDTLKAYSRIMKLRDAIIKSGDFAKIARDSSEDPSAKDNGGDLGFFSALQMVYPFEDAAYKAKIGDISNPVRTRFGYHIIKVTDSRPDNGEITVAHIMTKSNARSTDQELGNAKRKIDSLYIRLKNGEEFEKIAKESSEDPGSAKGGGQLPPFGTGRMVPEFEKVAFELKSKGDFSAPVKTAYGWHIIKLIEKKPVGTFEEVQSDLKSKISKDSRSEISRSSLIVKIKKENKFQEFSKNKDELMKLADTTLNSGNWDPSRAKDMKKPLFSLMDKNYNQNDFAKYLSEQQSKKKGMNPKQTFNTIYDLYVEESCISYKESRLEKDFPEFKALMEEYRDGILLFELTDRKVWAKAVKDSIGLKDYFEANKTKYLWPDRAEAMIFTCANAEVAKQARKLAKKDAAREYILEQLNKSDKNNVQIKQGLFSKGENEMVDKVEWKNGISPDNVMKDGKITFVKISTLITPMPKVLDEAKGLVTAEYQQQLEKEWLESLHKKYPVKINYDVLSGVK